jgi:hypothetical protein
LRICFSRSRNKARNREDPQQKRSSFRGEDDSPDFDPIEMALSKLKALLRKAGSEQSPPSGTPSDASSISSHQPNPQTRAFSDQSASYPAAEK